MSKLYCPNCKSTYEDQSLIYCLNDGTRLISLADDAEKTLQMSAQTNPLNKTFPDSAPTIQANQVQNLPPPERKKSGAGILIAFLVVGLLGIVAAIGAVGGYFMLADSSENPSVNAYSTANSAQAATNANSNDFDKTENLTKELEEKINRLEKQLESQKRTSQSNPAQNRQPSPDSSFVTARVNSPNDGFLALRSAPDTEGAQLAKIPHGATVTLNNCEKNTVKVSGRNGRWCNVNYAAKNGWVFSAWLDY